jgi:hypothetical protein
MAEMIPFDQRDGSPWLDGKVIPGARPVMC